MIETNERKTFNLHKLYQNTDPRLALFDLRGKPSGIWLLTINFMPFSLLWAAGLEVGVTLAEKK